MDRYRSSLKQKIAMVYVIGVSLIALLIVVTWLDIDHIEQTVKAGDVASNLFDTALEIRRFEKNYFLYHTESDYKELLSYISKADEILSKHRPELGIFAAEARIDEIEGGIDRYLQLLELGRDYKGPKEVVWEKDIRSIGRQIVDAAEKIARSEQEIARQTLESARKKLLILILAVMAAIAVGATLFYNKIIQPLKILEHHMDDVSKGDFSPVQMKTRDSEIASLNKAFNKMLHELEERKTYLVESEKLASLGTLLFGVAHELNNPISNISSSAQILREEIESGDIEFKRELIDQIEEGTERAQRIVSSLLDYSRTGTRERKKLKEIIDETLRFLKGEVPTKVALAVDIPDDITLMVDKQKIQQVFINLIKNSIEAIKDSGKVTVEARRNDQSGVISIQISDTGVGMEAGMVQKIFNPFFTTKGAKKGYGLGLFIVHNIIKEHGGSIMVSSEPGYGTKFYIELPVEEAQA